MGILEKLYGMRPRGSHTNSVLSKKVFLGDFRKEETRREFDFLCGETLVHLMLVAEKRKIDGFFAAECVVTAIDGEELSEDSLTPNRIQRYDTPPGNEEIETLVRKTIEGAGIAAERLVPVSEDYVESHRRIVSLRKRLNRNIGGA